MILAVEQALNAWMALEELLGCTEDPGIVSAARSAQQRLASPSRTPASAARALQDVAWAVERGDGFPARAKLREAEKAVRDVVVCRVQSKTPFGVREPFLEELRKAFDWMELSQESKLRSQLMHSHARVFAGFPGAFHSKSHFRQTLRMQTGAADEPTGGAFAKPARRPLPG